MAACPKRKANGAAGVPVRDNGVPGLEACKPEGGGVKGSEALPLLVETVSDVRRGVLTLICEFVDLDNTFGRLFIADGGRD